MGLLLILICTPLSADTIDSLFHVFESSQGRNRVKAANDLQKEIYDAGFLSKCTEISYDDTQINIDAYINCIMGTAALLKGDNYGGIKYFEKGIALYEEIGDTHKQTQYLLSLSFCYKMGGNYPKAFDCLQKCLTVFTDNNDELWMTRTLFTIGQLYSENNKDSLAIEYLNKSIEIMRRLDSQADCITILTILSESHLKLNNIEQAEESAKEALDISIKLNEINNWEYSLLTLGQVYCAKKEYDKSLDCFHQALKMNEENNGRTDYKAFAYYLIAGTYMESGKSPDKAEDYLLQSISLAEEAENVYYQQLAYTQLVNLNYTRNPQKALDFLMKQMEIKEALFDDQTRQQLNEFQIKYDTQEKELEIIRQQAEIGRQKIFRAILAGGLALMVIIMLLLWRMLRLRNKRNHELAEMNTTKDKFFSIISHDLKNPAIAQRSAIQMLIDQNGNWDADSLMQFYAELLKSADSQVELLYNLLNWAQVQTGRMPYTPSSFNLVDALRSEIALPKNMAKHKGISLDIKMPDKAIITGDRNMIATVVRNLLANAIKFTSEGGKVLLDIEINDSNCTVSVSDTGTGMSDEQLQNLYRIESRQSRNGTAGEQGSGLGLIVCKELVEKHGGKLNVESKVGEGSRFWFRVN